MKDFNEFKSTLSESKLEEIYVVAAKQTNEYMNSRTFSDKYEEFLIMNKELSVNITLGLLEEYHKWLNG